MPDQSQSLAELLNHIRRDLTEALGLFDSSLLPALGSELGAFELPDAKPGDLMGLAHQLAALANMLCVATERVVVFLVGANAVQQERVEPKKSCR